MLSLKKVNEKILKVAGSGITLTNNEIKGIIKVIRSLENRGNLLKETTEKTNSKEGGLPFTVEEKFT